MVPKNADFFIRHSRVRDIFYDYSLRELVSIKQGLRDYSDHPEYPCIMKKLNVAIDAEMGNFGFVFVRRDKEAEASLRRNGQEIYVNAQLLQAWLGHKD